MSFCYSVNAGEVMRWFVPSFCLSVILCFLLSVIEQHKKLTNVVTDVDQKNGRHGQGSSSRSS